MEAAQIPGLGSEAEAIVRIVVALLAGMLIGVEREKARAAQLSLKRSGSESLGEAIVKEFPGIRTFSLISLYGALTGLLWSRGLILELQAAVLLAVFGVVVVSFLVHRLFQLKIAGITTIVVMLVAFLTGFLSGVGMLVLAVSTAVLTTFVLAIKLPVEKVIGRITYVELLWALELGIVLAVLGPIFLPSRISFYGVSLRSIYLFVVLVLAISYVGYVMVRLRGGEGLLYASIFGALANSEAAMAALLGILPAERRRRLASTLAYVVNSAMLLRNLGIAVAVYALAPAKGVEEQLAAFTLATLLGVVPLAPSLARLKRIRGPLAAVEIENPLRFKTALRGGLLYIVIAFAIHMLQSLGQGGLLAVAALGGFFSSSATILALFTSEAVGTRELVQLAVAASIAGMLNKPLYAYQSSGSREAASVLASSAVQALLMVAGLLAASQLRSTLS
ncbi:MAG: DUF4010 domain-containing protein [Thermoproteota archaeon]